MVSCDTFKLLIRHCERKPLLHRLAGDEAFAAARAYYQNVKVANKDGVTDAKPIFDDLSTRFPGGRRATTQPTPDPVPATT